MREIVKYEHHGREVSVIADVKGQHREHCLCFQGCARFRPHEPQANCPIANALFALCVEHGLATPVFECAEYEAA